MLLAILLAAADPAPGLGDLLTNPQVLALLGITGAGGGVAGWVIKGVVSAAKAETKTELELAMEALERAHKTEKPEDDVEAQKHVDFWRRVKGLVDSVPDLK